MTGEYRYPFSSIRGDCIRAVIGFVVCVTPVLAGLKLMAALWFLVPLMVVFLSFFIRTILRYMTTITVTDEWIRVNSFLDTTVYWTEVTDFNLSYFTLWRNGEKGWMQMRLRNNKNVIRIESSLDGFEDIACRALAAAEANRLSLNLTTTSNLEVFSFYSNSREVERG